MLILPFNSSDLLSKLSISAPSNSPEKPLYMRELDNIYLLTFNNNKQTKQREDNEQFTKTRYGLIRIEFCGRYRREDPQLGP